MPSLVQNERPMHMEFREIFLKDIRAVRDKATLTKLQQLIASVENAEELSQISNLKRLKGGDGQYYRIRMGDYRVGLTLAGGIVTFVRFLHRRDIYRYFP